MSTYFSSVVKAIDELITLIAGPGWDTPDAFGNGILYPPEPSTPPRNDDLTVTEARVTTSGPIRRRVCMIIGPGATIRGIADRLLPFYKAATPPDPPSWEELARGIAVYNRGFLPLSTMSDYTLGLRLTLPIEIDDATSGWIVCSDDIRKWSGGEFGAAAAGRLDDTPSLLEQPDEQALPGEARRFLAAYSDPSLLAMALVGRILTNPFEAVFLVFEMLRQLGADAFGAALELVTPPEEGRLGGGFRDDELDLLASLTAGNAILRQLEMILANAPNPPNPEDFVKLEVARDRLRQCLRPDGQRVEASELHETPQQLVDRGSLGVGTPPTDPKGGIHRIVLGRDILAGTIGSTTNNSLNLTFSGPTYVGRLPVDTFVVTHGGVVPSGGGAARLEIVNAITPNEGNLDAIAMLDKAILSTGIQQWSMHVDTEALALLALFKEMALDEFNLYFRLYGLEVRANGADAHGNPMFMLQKVEADESLTDIPLLLSEPPINRLFFFGGQYSSSTTVEFDTLWAGRFRLASLTSLKYRVAEVRMATDRFDRILREVPPIQIANPPSGPFFALPDLISSKYGVALILDSHINKPDSVPGNLEAAAKAANPAQNANDREKAIIATYKTIRDVADRLSRNLKIDNATGLDKHHGSFAGW